MRSLTRSLILVLSFSFVSTICSAVPTESSYCTSDVVKHNHLTSTGKKGWWPPLAQKLFPKEFKYHSGFTTAFGVYVPGISQVPLDDESLNVVKVSSGTTHNVTWQNPKLAWEAIYPEGSINPSNTPRGGFGFYLGGSDEFYEAISNGADDVVLSYSVMFDYDFEFNRGGKVPGAFGGLGDEAFACSGGRQEEREKCFNARLMWRTDGAGEIYTYLPITDENDKAQLSVPGTVADSTYGYSVGRGAFTFPTGKWITVAQRVKLNTVGNSDGLIELWVDGKKKIELKNVMLRDDVNATIQGAHFQTFFGGSTIEWASPKTQKAWFADVSGAVIKK